MDETDQAAERTDAALGGQRAQAVPGRGETEVKGTSEVSPEAAAHDPPDEDSEAGGQPSGVLRYDQPVSISAFDRMLAGMRGRMVNVRAHLIVAKNGDTRACAHALSELADLVEHLFDGERWAG